jgi:3-deoxy-D-manno-octulosonate 8-phosphate phosphatase (KDO 8-P phosphatase)
MPFSPHNDMPADIRRRAAAVRLLALDVDGTLTDGRILLDGGALELKAFSVLDGQGLKLAQRIGIEVALVTARSSEVVARRARELGIHEVHQGVRDKRACVEALLAARGLDGSALAYMGDDLPDLAPMALAGLAVAPSNAHAWVRERAHWRTRAAGGDGAARELCDLLIGAQGQADAVLASFLPPPGPAA